MDGSRWKAGVLLVLVFVAGAAVGIAGDRLDLIPKPIQATEPAEPGRDAGDRSPRQRAEDAEDAEDDDGADEDQTTIERFADDLGLTAAQRTEIETLLDRYRASTRELWHQVRPKYRALMDSVRVEIEAVLTPEQVEQYRALLRERYGGGDRERDGDRRDR